MTPLHLRDTQARLRDDEALSLVEILIAMFVLAVAVLGLAGVASASLTQLRAARDRDLATNVAASTIETLRGLEYDGVAVYDPGGAAPACRDDEELVTTSDPAEGIAFTRTEGPNARFDVTTYVTWFDEANYTPGVGDAAACTAPSARIAKRVTVVTSWASANGVTRQVWESTVVAEAGRGLPVPDFRVLPVDQIVSFTPGELSGEKCVSHLLTNTGAEDSYEWTLLRAKQGSTDASITGPVDETRIGPDEDGDGSADWTRFYDDVFTVQGGKVKVRAMFEYNLNHDPDDDTSTSVSPVTASDVADDVPAEGLNAAAGTLDPDYFQQMQDGLAESGSDSRPETDRRVPNRQSARVWICYLLDGSQTNGTSYTFDVRLNSQFDEERTETVSHTVSVGADPLRLYFFDPDDTQAHKRNANETYTMGELNPGAGVTLGTGGPYDWDTDDDPFNRPFVWLGEDEGTGVALRWHHQFTGGATLDTAATLTFWTAPSSNLGGAAAPQELTYNIEIERLTDKEKSFSPAKFLWTTSHTYTHTTTSWERQQLTLSLDPANTTFGANEYIRVRIYCAANTSGEDCNVAYDHTAYPSSLLVDRVTS